MRTRRLTSAVGLLPPQMAGSRECGPRRGVPVASSPALAMGTAAGHVVHAGPGMCSGPESSILRMQRSTRTV